MKAMTEYVHKDHQALLIQEDHRYLLEAKGFYKKTNSHILREYKIIILSMGRSK